MFTLITFRRKVSLVKGTHYNRNIKKWSPATAELYFTNIYFAIMAKENLP